MSRDDLSDSIQEVISEEAPEQMTLMSDETLAKHAAEFKTPQDREDAMKDTKPAFATPVSTGDSEVKLDSMGFPIVK